MHSLELLPPDQILDQRPSQAVSPDPKYNFFSFSSHLNWQSWIFNHHITSTDIWQRSICWCLQLRREYVCSVHVLMTMSTNMFVYSSGSTYSCTMGCQLDKVYSWFGAFSAFAAEQQIDCQICFGLSVRCVIVELRHEMDHATAFCPSEKWILSQHFCLLTQQWFSIGSRGQQFRKQVWAEKFIFYFLKQGSTDSKAKRSAGEEIPTETCLGIRETFWRVKPRNSFHSSVRERDWSSICKIQVFFLKVHQKSFFMVAPTPNLKCISVFQVNRQKPEETCSSSARRRTFLWIIDLKVGFTWRGDQMEVFIDFRFGFLAANLAADFVWKYTLVHSSQAFCAVCTEL